MSVFTRSDSGIINRPLFLDYDFLVLIESRDHKPNAPSPELTYWAGVVDHYGPQGRYRIQRMGNKTAAIEYALKLDSLNQSNYFCCVDRDCDDMDPNYTLPKKIVQTAGYSFESDCVFADSVLTVLGLHVGRVDVVETFAFAEHLEKFEAELRWAIVADVLCLRRGVGFFYRTSRDFIGLFEAHDYAKVPTINRKKCVARVRDIKAAYPAPADVFHGGGFARCYGKLVIWWFYRVVVSLIASVDSKYRLSEETFRRNLVMSALAATKGGVFPHDAQYSAQFG